MDAVQGSPTSASEVAAAAEPLQSATRNIVVVGASAGGVKALRGLLSGLPANYGGSIFVVMHISPDSRSELPSILTRDSALPRCTPRTAWRSRPGASTWRRPTSTC
jgi:two-component system chemotaxis response regulator CheB